MVKTLLERQNKPKQVNTEKSQTSTKEIESKVSQNDVKDGLQKAEYKK